MQFEDVMEAPTARPQASAWIARDRQERTVLIKRLPDEGAKIRATQSLALRNPQIVPTRCWLRDRGAFYVVRDYIPGQNLRQRLSNAGLRAVDRMQTVLNPLLDALDYAHRSGVPHGGITPENILITTDGTAMLSDFATVGAQKNGNRRYAPAQYFTSEGNPTPRADFYAVCELYKEFLPERAADDEAGHEARERILRNLCEVQLSSASIDELRYKLGAVAKMAALLGFNSESVEQGRRYERRSARLESHVTPASVEINPGAVGSVSLSVHNAGDTNLHVETVGADVVWLNYHTRFTPFVLPPDTGRDLIFAISGARLQPGTYQTNLIVRSNHGMQTSIPPTGTPWHEERFPLPVVVKGQIADTPKQVPLAEKLPVADPPKAIPQNGTSEAPPLASPMDENPAIACTQNPDPALVRYGQHGVVHVGIQNIGHRRMRVDKLSTSPSWLVYPGEFQAVWIDPGTTEYLGFSIITTNLPGGDYKATVTMIISYMIDVEVGTMTLWREMQCEVRVRIVRDIANIDQPGGCAPVIITTLSLAGAIIARFLLS